MKTAAYTICKNEIKKIDQWLHYTKDFDYRVILDTGSTDGTYEAFSKVPNIILDQHIVDPEEFRYDVPRNINLSMVPKDVDWCLSPDVDEYFSINVLEEIENMVKNYPDVTNIACTRLDIYSKKVFVGQPYSIGTNKIHRRNLYSWKQPVYEHLSYTGIAYELEVYNDQIFLIHDQDITKPRNVTYPKFLKKEYQNNPLNNWNNWFLANHYYIEKDLENFVDVALNYVLNPHDREESKFNELMLSLVGISTATNVDEETKNRIKNKIGHLL